MLRYVLEQSRDCIKILSPEGAVDYINSEGRCGLEIDDFSKVQGKPWPELWPEGSREIVVRAIEQAQTGESSEIEALRPDSRGGERWWRISVSPLLESDDSLAGMLVISRDVTEHVWRREAEQSVALEMRHRLRNAYTVASAIVMQSARGDAERVRFAELVCARLADVALSQTRLLDAGQKSWALADLVRVLIDAHGEGAAGIRYAGDAEAVVDGHAATVVALVIGELTNNSLKYGALRKGRSVSLTASVDDDSITIRWREKTNAGSDEALTPRDAGSGYAMMQRMARAQSASFEHEMKKGELSAVVRVRRSTQ